MILSAKFISDKNMLEQNGMKTIKILNRTTFWHLWKQKYINKKVPNMVPANKMYLSDNSCHPTITCHPEMIEKIKRHLLII